jgi:proteic killer suppression protein
MDVRFKQAFLDRLETDPDYNYGLAPPVVQAYRKRLQQIRAAPDERVLYALKSLDVEKLRGSSDQQRSMRINDEWRLIIELECKPTGKVVLVVGLEEDHD